MSEIHIHIDLGWNANQTDKNKRNEKKKCFSFTNNLYIIIIQSGLWVDWQSSSRLSHFFSNIITSMADRRRTQEWNLCQRGRSSELPWRWWPKRKFKHKETQYRIWHKVKQAMGGYCFWFKTEKKRRNLWFRGLQRILMPRMCRQGRKFLVYLFRLYSLLCCGLYQRGPSLLS